MSSGGKGANQGGRAMEQCSGYGVSVLTAESADAKDRMHPQVR